MRPRPYISFSQKVLIERSPHKYVEQYLFGEKQHTSQAMAYGSKLADSLEFDELSGDMAIDIMAEQLPKFELMDIPIQDYKKGVWVDYYRHGKVTKYQVPFLKATNGNKIPILAVPDTSKEDLSAFKEYKTGTTKWDQKMADASNQITFYAMGAYLKTGKIPEDIELVHLPTEYDDNGKVHLTGEMNGFPTKRTMQQILNMMLATQKAWAKIEEVCDDAIIQS